MKKRKLAFLGLLSAGAFMLGASSEPEPEISEISEPETSMAEISASESEEPASSMPEDADFSAVNEFLGKWFSPEMILEYVTTAAYIATIIKLFLSLIKATKEKGMSLKEVVNTLTKVIEEKVGEKVAEQFNKVVPNLIAGQENSNKVLTIFAKILALSQENTPESKVAILDLIGELGSAGKELVDNAKNAIEETVKLEQAAKEEMDEKLDAIVDQYDGTSI